jgi:hypothetical protein
MLLSVNNNAAEAFVNLLQWYHALLLDEQGNLTTIDCQSIVAVGKESSYPCIRILCRDLEEHNRG